MDETLKETLLVRLRAYLDGLDQEEGDRPEEPRDTADLFSIFVELAGLRSEVRTESRVVKEALDQFRGVFELLQASHATMEEELKRTRAESRARGREILRPLLLDILDLRDRLAAGLKSNGPAPQPSWWQRRFSPKTQPEAEPWREGLSMSLRRLDRLLDDRRITAIETIGRPFDPRLARAVTTVADPAVSAGIVVEELRPGFLWEDELLRLAEVAVSKDVTGKGEKI